MPSKSHLGLPVLSICLALTGITWASFYFVGSRRTQTRNFSAECPRPLTKKLGFAHAIDGRKILSAFFGLAFDRLQQPSPGLLDGSARSEVAFPYEKDDLVDVLKRQ